MKFIPKQWFGGFRFQILAGETPTITTKKDSRWDPYSQPFPLDNQIQALNFPLPLSCVLVRCFFILILPRPLSLSPPFSGLRHQTGFLGKSDQCWVEERFLRNLINHWLSLGPWLPHIWVLSLTASLVLPPPPLPFSSTYFCLYAAIFLVW